MNATADGESRAVRQKHEQIEAAMGHSLHTQWVEVLDTWEEGASSQKKAILAYVSGLRNRIHRGLLDIDAMDELDRAIAIQYVEVKCHWMMLNTRIQNQTARQGGAELNMTYMATCVSLIIQALEPLLMRGQVDTLTNFLAEPLQ